MATGRDIVNITRQHSGEQGVFGERFTPSA
jgi:hypothetical protein